jgi:hypothetical protein
MSRRNRNPKNRRGKNTQPAGQPLAASSQKPKKTPKLDATTLALIAAQVAPKRFVKSQDAVNYAYQLWEDSKDLLSYDDYAQSQFQAADKEAENAKLPEHGGPYDFKAFLERVVDGDIKNRRNRFTEFLKSYPKEFPTPDVTIRALENDGLEREEWIDTANWFQAWRVASFHSKKSAAGQAGHKARKEKRLKQINELLEDLKRDRLRPRKETGQLNEFYKMVVEGPNRNVSERRFMDYLECQPENTQDPRKAGEALNYFKDHGFTLLEWKETAFKVLNWRIKNIDKELSPQNRRSAR